MESGVAAYLSRFDASFVAMKNIHINQRSKTLSSLLQG
jgi:hypothetical protein